MNDDTLARSFSRFPSFLRSKVIRDRYSKKTKGYGFVSFKDPKDFMSAMREMNGECVVAQCRINHLQIVHLGSGCLAL